MHNKFPIIEHIDQVKAAIKDREEFIIADRGDYFIANYNVCFPYTFIEEDGSINENTMIRRECRGLTFDAKGNVIARKFHKFFNLGEKTETQPEVLQKSYDDKVIILDKLDGSMITPVLVNGKLEWHTKMGNTDISKFVEFFIKDKVNYEAMALYFIKELSLTPIFEFTSRMNRIVIDYPETNLTLLAARHRNAGEYLNYEHLLLHGKNFDIPVVKNLKDTTSDLLELSKNVSEKTNIEGYVLRFDDGHMVKIKCSEYVLFHKSKDELSQEKNVWKLILEDKLDDILPLLTEEDVIKMIEFSKSLNDQIMIFTNNLNKIHKDFLKIAFEHSDPEVKILASTVIDGEEHSLVTSYWDERERRKQFALYVGHKTDVFQRAIIFKVYEGHDIIVAVREFMLKHVGTSSSIEAMRKYFGNIKWNFYGVESNE